MSSRRGQRQLLVNCVMGCELFNPHVKGHLRKARAVYAGWEKVQPSRSPPPVPAALISLLSLTLRAAEKPDVGLALLLTFHGLLRISEICSLEWRDVLLPGDVRLPRSVTRNGERGGGLLIRVGKTGVLQFIPLADPTLLRFLVRAKNVHWAPN